MHADAMPYPPPRLPQVVQRRNRQSRSGCAQRMSQRNRAAVRIEPKSVRPYAHLAQTRNHLRRKRLVDFHDGKIAFSDAGALRALSEWKTAGPIPMMLGSTPTTLAPTMRPIHVEAVGFGLFDRRQHDRGRAIGDAARITRRHDAVFDETRGQPAELLHGKAGARAFVLVDGNGRTFRAGNLNRDDFLGEISIGLRFERALLTGKGEIIALLARHAVLFC